MANDRGEWGAGEVKIFNATGPVSLVIAPYNITPCMILPIGTKGFSLVFRISLSLNPSCLIQPSFGSSRYPKFSGGMAGFDSSSIGFWDEEGI